MPNLTNAICSTVDENEAARFLGLKNRKTLYHWRVKREGPPYLKYGRLIRYRIQDLAEWQDSRMVVETQRALRQTRELHKVTNRVRSSVPRAMPREV